VSIQLPHELAVVLDWLGFPWPEVDEDQIREAADQLRAYARGSAAALDDTDRRVTVDLAASCSSASYRALAAVWAGQTRGHMDVLVDGCGVLAGALDLTADGVAAMKLAVIAQLGIAAVEFAATQAAAVATAGLAEAALPVLYVAQNRVLHGIVSEFESEVVSQLLHAVTGPLGARIAAAVDALVHGELIADPGAEPGVQVDVEAVRAQSAALHAAADSHAGDGRVLQGSLSGLSFAAA